MHAPLIRRSLAAVSLQYCRRIDHSATGAVGDAGTNQGTANMEADHETRRKIIREWRALPKDKRQTEEQVAAFAKKAVEQSKFHHSRRDPNAKFRRDPFEKIMGWLLPRAGK
jgi:hypothetical protein